MPICLHTVCGCFCAAAAAEMNSCNRVWPAKQKIFTLVLKRKVAHSTGAKGSLI